MNQRTQVPARTERLRTVSVPKAVAAFLVAGLFVLTAVGIVLALALRQTATAEAIRVARLVTSLEATSVVGQVLVDEALVPGPAYDKLDQVVRQHVISSQIVRIKVATGLSTPSACDLAKIEVSCRVKYVTGQVRRSGHRAQSVEAAERLPSLKVARLDRLQVAVWPAAVAADVHPLDVAVAVGFDFAPPSDTDRRRLS